MGGRDSGDGGPGNDGRHGPGKARKIQPARRWFGARRPREPDFADHGTAFALDLRLHQAAQETAVTAASASPPLPPPQAAAGGWIRRLARRRSG